LYLAEVNYKKHKRAEEKEQGQIKTAFSADTNDIWAPFTLSLSFFCLLMINILLEPNFLQKIISIWFVKTKLFTSKLRIFHNLGIKGRIYKIF
jgi:hypothetical protein